MREQRLDQELYNPEQGPPRKKKRFSNGQLYSSKAVTKLLDTLEEFTATANTNFSITEADEIDDLLLSVSGKLNNFAKRLASRPSGESPALKRRREDPAEAPAKRVVATVKESTAPSSPEVEEITAAPRKLAAKVVEEPSSPAPFTFGKPLASKETVTPQFGTSQSTVAKQPETKCLEPESAAPKESIFTFGSSPTPSIDVLKEKKADSAESPEKVTPKPIAFGSFTPGTVSFGSTTTLKEKSSVSEDRKSVV